MSFLTENVVLVLLLAGVVLALLLLAVVVGAALKGGGGAGSGAAVKTLRLLGVESLRRSFRKAVALVEANLATRARRYDLSWTLLLDDSAGAGLPLQDAGLPSAIAGGDGPDAAAQGIAWHFFDKGLVVQLRTGYLGPAGADAGAGAADGVWDDFLALCRGYRPLRPFDAIVLALPCTALVDLDPDGQRALAARAQALHRRLWLAQNRLAMRFPIHLVVTECETIPGFASFGAALPQPLRRSILGWASPYELVAPFRPQWIDSAMDQVTESVADACAALSAVAPGDEDSSAYFLLPSGVEKLRAGLKQFCEELMRPSAYHESFLLRGVYLTGDSSDTAVLQAAAGGGRAAPAPELVAPGARLPVFLRDIFERKVFPEVGLVRASRQRLRRPAARTLGYWTALLVPLAWTIALVVGAWQLHGEQRQLVPWLKAPQQPAPGQDGMAARRDLQLEDYGRIAAIRFYSVAMPGSWPAVDGLDEALHQRLETVFANKVVTRLRAAAADRLKRLTGVAAVVRGTEYGASGACTLPGNWNAVVSKAPAAGLDLRTLPEYVALKQYLENLRDLDLAAGAMRRLAAGSAPANGADLVTATRLLLNIELSAALGDNATLAALYREAAQGRSDLGQPLLSGAAACTLDLAAAALFEHLFAHNALVTAEAATRGAIEQVRASDFAVDARLAAWKNLQKLLGLEQALLGNGQGAWIHESELRLGGDFDELIRSVRRNNLLGDEPAAAMRAQAHAQFETLSADWIDADDATAAGARDLGLAWNGKAWAFTPERAALAKAVQDLLAPSYMTLSAALPWPAVPADATVAWDKAQRERAASLMEARKVFQAGAYLGFPPLLQPAAGALVDALLVASAGNALAQAASAGAPAMPGAAADAERASVLAIRNWVAELGAPGARPLATAIDGLLEQDALVRLKRLDAVFNNAQVYLPRDPAFQSWQGRKGVMVDAFGAGDAVAMNAYLDEQKDFVDAIVTQADGVVTLLGSTGATGGERGNAGGLVARWQALRLDLARYRQKSPASSQLALENFIRTGSADIELANCRDKLGARQPARSASDVFAARLQALHDNLLAQCLNLAGSAEQRQWRAFADAWNRDLVQRAPFAAIPDGYAGKPGDWNVPADHDAVGAVLRLYDSARAAGRLAGAPVRADEPQLRRVRELLAPLYPADDGTPGGLDVAVQFRANPGAERNAAQIIDWSLTIGPATLHKTELAHPLRWEPGMPVTLALRLAQDGGHVPALKANLPGMAVSERIVRYGFDDPWALFTFIKAYARPDGAGDDGRAPLLGFPFNLAPAGALAAGGPDDNALVFLRLRLSAPGKLAPLAWPAVYPARLPLSNDLTKTDE